MAIYQLDNPIFYNKAHKAFLVFSKASAGTLCFMDTQRTGFPPNPRGEALRGIRKGRIKDVVFQATNNTALSVLQALVCVVEPRPTVQKYLFFLFSKVSAGTWCFMNAQRRRLSASPGETLRGMKERHCE